MRKYTLVLAIVAISASTAASLLSCRNEAAPEGRVRVVCR